MTSCQNSDGRHVPVDEDHRALRRRRRVVALALEDVHVQSGRLDDAGSVMPSKRVMAGPSLSTRGAGAPVSSTIAPPRRGMNRPSGHGASGPPASRVELTGVEARYVASAARAAASGSRSVGDVRVRPRVGRAAVKALPSSLNIQASAAPRASESDRAPPRCSARPSSRRSQPMPVAPRAELVPESVGHVGDPRRCARARRSVSSSPIAARRTVTQVTPPPYSHVTR